MRSCLRCCARHAPTYASPTAWRSSRWDAPPPRPGEELPAEPRRVAAVLAGPREPAQAGSRARTTPLDFFDAKGVHRDLLARLGVTDVAWQRADTPRSILAERPSRPSAVSSWASSASSTRLSAPRSTCRTCPSPCSTSTLRR